MTDLYFFDSSRMLTRLSIAPTPMWEDWRPTLQRVVVSDGESRVVALSPSLPGAVPPRPIASTETAAATVLAAIPVVTAEAMSEVSLVAPPPPAMVEEERETRLPIPPSGGLRGSPSRSALEASGGDAARTELERLSVACAIEVVEIPSDDEAYDKVEPPMLSRELAVV